MATAEIVHFQVNTELPKLCKPFKRLTITFVEKDRLQQLEGERARRNGKLLQLFQERRVAQAPVGYVY
ncbi:Uncharacterised protein [Mycobacterium tuberculosis]|nr:Uncharacterised protein [Mycobacterium tuberculosis]